MPRQRFRSISGGSLSEMTPKRTSPSKTLSDISYVFNIWIKLSDDNKGKSFFHCKHTNSVTMIGLMQKIIHLASLLDRGNEEEDFDQQQGKGPERKNSNASEMHSPNNSSAKSAMKNSKSMLETLLLAREDESGYTALHNAIMNRDIAVILKILRHAVIDVKDQQLFDEDKCRGRLAYRPMSMLQGDVNHDLLQKLVFARDNEGFTPLDLLCKLQQTELEKCRRCLFMEHKLTDEKIFDSKDGKEYDEFEFELEEDNEFHVLHTINNTQERSRQSQSSSKLSGNQYGCEVLTFGRANHCALGVFRSSDSSVSEHHHHTKKISPTKGNTMKNTSPSIQRVQAFGLSNLGPEKSATAIAAASHHTLVATRNGHLYSFGLGKGGRLGLGDERNQPLPMRILGPLAKRFVVSIAAAENHSLCVTNDGNVYGWGSNRFGQLGSMSHRNASNNEMNENSQRQRFTPRKVDSLNGVFCINVAVGDRHSVALSQKGEVYCWGDNQVGQLGTSLRAGVGAEGNPGNARNVSCGTYKAARVNALWEAVPKKIAISISASENSTMVLTRLPKSDNVIAKNSVYSWGHGNHVPIRVNFSSNQDSSSTFQMHHVNPISIACAKYHNVAVMSDGRVFTWGLHTDHLGLHSTPKKKMGDEKHTRSMVIASPQLVTGMLSENGGGVAVTVSASDSHTAVLTDCGHLYTWGVNDSKNVLGHEGVRWQPIPKKVPGVFRAVDVAVAKEHTVLLVGTSFPKIEDNHKAGWLQSCKPTLQEVSARAVACHVDLFNVIPILVSAERIQSSFLKAYCKEFIRYNLDGVLAVGRKSEMDCYLNESLYDGLNDLENIDRDENFHPFILSILQSLDADFLGGINTYSSLWKEKFESLLERIPKHVVEKNQISVFSDEKLKSLSRSRSQSFGHNSKPSRCRTASMDIFDENATTKQTSDNPQLGVDCESRQKQCSERCLMLTSNLNLKTSDAIKSKHVCLSKEIRGIRKRLNQIEKLLQMHDRSPSSLTDDEQEKISRRPLFEADLIVLEEALDRVKIMMNKFGLEDAHLKKDTKDVNSAKPPPLSEKKSKNVCNESGMNTTLLSSQFRCEICNIICPDQSSFTLHCNGRKHANRIKQNEDKEKREMAEMMQKKHIKLMMNRPSVTPTRKEPKNPWSSPESASLIPKYNLKPPPKFQSNEIMESAATHNVRNVEPKWFNDVLPASNKNKSFRQIIAEEKKLSYNTKCKKVDNKNARALQTPQVRSPNITNDSFKQVTPIGSSLKESMAKGSSGECRKESMPTFRAFAKSDVDVNESKRALWLGDFVQETRKKPLQTTKLPSWNVSSAAKPPTTPQKSLLQIQEEEESLRSRQDPRYALDGSWFIERRERAGSFSMIQNEAEKEREFELLAKEQKRIEEQIKSDLENQQRQKQKQKQKQNQKKKKMTQRKNMKNQKLGSKNKKNSQKDANVQECQKVSKMSNGCKKKSSRSTQNKVAQPTTSV